MMKHLDLSSYAEGKFGQITSRDVTISDLYFLKITLGFFGILCRECSRIEYKQRDLL